MRKNKSTLPGTSLFTWLLAFIFIKPILFIIFLFHNLTYLPHQKKLPKGPWLLMGNHHSNWDGLYAVTYYYHTIPHFIVHDSLFKFQWLGWLISHWFGQINRGSIDSRWTGARQLMTYALANHTVGLFPEGDISLLGGSLPFDISVAKLAKKIALPIVVFHIKGAYQRAPRWSDRTFKTKVSIQTVDVISLEEIQQLPLETLLEKIRQAVHVDAYDNKPIRVKSNTRAERLERALFCCPKCQTLFSLRSHKNDFWCQTCSWQVLINESLTYTYRTPLDLNVPSHPKAHDIWQKEWIAKHPEKINNIHAVVKIEEIDNINHTTKRYSNATITLSPQTLTIHIDSTDRIVEIKDIKFVQLIHRTSWSMMYQNHQYIFHPQNESPPGSFWVYSIDLHQRFLYNNKEV
jgi:1-acyl-sn-glycerol-3-phosphate acyltransferase